MRATTRWLLGIVVLAGTLSACQNSHDQAQEQAITDARDGAEYVRATFESAASPNKTSEELRDSIVKVLPAGEDNVTSAPTIDNNGSVTVTGIFFAKGEAHDGFSFSDYTVRMCLEYTITNTPPRATVTDIPCPTDAPTSSGNSGTADRTIRLTD